MQVIVKIKNFMNFFPQNHLRQRLPVENFTSTASTSTLPTFFLNYEQISIETHILYYFDELLGPDTTQSKNCT